jgi:hypothetical protein
MIITLCLISGVCFGQKVEDYVLTGDTNALFHAGRNLQIAQTTQIVGAALLTTSALISKSDGVPTPVVLSYGILGIMSEIISVILYYNVGRELKHADKLLDKRLRKLEEKSK